MKTLKTTLSALTLAMGAGTAGIANADIVHNDDVIITFSLCVGNDCVNGENFGFDTLRLKENNLRIHFDDTSTSASFPRNDWRIVVNDSGNGGASYFAIEDSTSGRTPFKVEAGAIANALYVDDQGDVGIGTSTPVVEVHAVDGNTPTLRLEQNGSSGFTPQTWDLAGNEANFFIRDVTNGSKLSFRIEPNTPQDALYLDSTGNIGMGTNAPGGALHIKRTGLVIPSIESSNNQAVQLRLRTNDGNRRVVGVDSADNAQSQLVFGDSEVQILGPTAADDYLVVNATGLTVKGTITQNTTVIHPDYVFEPTYKLESIEDHANYMFTEKHLPAVGAGTYDNQGRAIIDLGAKTMGILEELEKAHLYIVEIHGRMNAMEKQNAQLQEVVAELLSED